MGIVDAASSLGVADFNIDDYPGVVAWASCPQKGMLSLPLTTPVSFTDKAIEAVRKRGVHTYVHHPILEARHWALSTARTWLRQPITAPIPAMRWRRSTRHCASSSTTGDTVKPQTAYHEEALRRAAEAMGCDVTYNTTSLIVLNLLGKLAGKEMELVAGCRARGFGIWPTLSEPIQVRIGILNQLTPEAITEIAGRFADAMLAMGSEFDKQQVMNGLKSYYAKAA